MIETTKNDCRFNNGLSIFDLVYNLFYGLFMLNMPVDGFVSQKKKCKF